MLMTKVNVKKSYYDLVSIELSPLVNIRPDGDTNKGEGHQTSGYVL